jgi:hypothetical protein
MGWGHVVRELRTVELLLSVLIVELAVLIGLVLR